MESFLCNAVWLKLVASVNHHVNSELARCRRVNGCFLKPSSLLVFHVSICSTTILWQAKRCATCNKGTWCFQCNFATSVLGNFDHMEKFEGLILHCTLVWDSTSAIPLLSTPGYVVFNYSHWCWLYLHKRRSVDEHFAHKCSTRVEVRMHAKLIFLEDIVVEKLSKKWWHFYNVAVNIFVYLAMSLMCVQEGHVSLYNDVITNINQNGWCTNPCHMFFIPLRQESQYGENDGNSNCDVHCMKLHCEQSVTPSYEHKEKMVDIVLLWIYLLSNSQPRVVFLSTGITVAVEDTFWITIGVWARVA